MSRKQPTFPSRGFALFASKSGGVEVRTVNVIGVHEQLDAASVTESVTGTPHVLRLFRLASEKTLAAKRAAYAANLAASLQFSAPADTATLEMAGMTQTATEKL
jgi:hypothetical protein